ncbi:hypothetical protein [Rosenbergiella australiborealis]|uniref:hypothetical protein n=1 Tax=Rosenbergiella australiborealis TaxID=1544696 RepID=UPI001F4EE7DE|nr:hypothetical protein [Rosenbergiella australiborealis]
MMKIPHFRRNAGGLLAGITEKVEWKLSKGPQTGQQLADHFNLTLGQINAIMRDSFRGDTSKVSFGEPYKTEGRAMDRLYTLEKKPKRVMHKKKKQIILNYRKFEEQHRV